jgi:hypothetical protein
MEYTAARKPTRLLRRQRVPRKTARRSWQSRQRAVDTLQNAMPIPIISRRLPGSASRAMGSRARIDAHEGPAMQYGEWVSEMPRCERRGAQQRENAAIDRGDHQPTVRITMRTRHGRTRPVAISSGTTVVSLGLQPPVAASIDGFSACPSRRFNRQGTRTPPVRNCA